MTRMSGKTPRAVGRRIGYTGLPAALRDWLDHRFGPVRIAREHDGGMSPGCATSVRTPDGETLFVKAVGEELNAQTVALFRQELALLRRLPAATHRPALLAAYDRDGWVALVLEHVPGRYPDLAVDADFAAVAEAVAAQSDELTPPPDGVEVPTLATTTTRWAVRWAEIRDEPARFLPAWAVARLPALDARVRRLPGQLPATSLCHFDLRDDNLLIRDDGRAVVLDWGMARRGPAWVDLALLAAQKPTAAEADQWLRRWLPDAAQDVATSLFVAFGGSQAWNARQPARPALPTFTAYCRDDARRLLSLAHLRLPVPPA